MKKVKNLDELEKMVGRESVEKCFTEYMLSVIVYRRMKNGQCSIRRRTGTA